MDRVGYTMLPVERIRQTEMTTCDLWKVCSPLRANSDKMSIMLILPLNRY